MNTQEDQLKEDKENLIEQAKVIQELKREKLALS